MVRQAIIFAAVAMSASAQMYGAYGPYGGFAPEADVMPFEPSPSADVMPIEMPSPSMDVMPADIPAPMPGMDVMPIDIPAPMPAMDVMPIDVPAPSPGAAVMPMAPMSTLEGCFIDHGLGCEQCMEGFYKVGTAEAPTCAPCDFEACTFCNDFVGCGQCDPGFFIVMGEDGYQACDACAGNADGFAMGCTPAEVAA